MGQHETHTLSHSSTAAYGRLQNCSSKLSSLITAGTSPYKCTKAERHTTVSFATIGGDPERMACMSKTLDRRLRSSCSGSRADRAATIRSMQRAGSWYLSARRSMRSSSGPSPCALSVISPLYMHRNTNSAASSSSCSTCSVSSTRLTLVGAVSFAAELLVAALDPLRLAGGSTAVACWAAVASIGFRRCTSALK